MEGSSILVDFQIVRINIIGPILTTNIFFRFPVRQHGVFNTNPTCKQFTAVLMTTVLNGLAVPISEGNVELDYCEQISNCSSPTKMSRFKKQKLCHDNTNKTETKPI